MWPHRRQPTRLPRPWDSPGKNTGVGCHFLLQCMTVKNESEVAQLCLTVSDPMDCGPPGSSVHGIFQARVLEWGAIAFSARYAGEYLRTISVTSQNCWDSQMGWCPVGFPRGSDGKESACNAGDPCLIPGSGRFPGEENGNSLQYSCLENSINRGAWQLTVHGVIKSWTWLSD